MGRERKFNTIPPTPPINFEWVLGNATLKRRQDPRIREYQVYPRFNFEWVLDNITPPALANSRVSSQL